ncbi:MAG: ribonuclease III [Candidatus Eremiobacteraeota bacterium]|nr:ribonuclease III [Candidatus Eremiobacteraeota bacterium]
MAATTAWSYSENRARSPEMSGEAGRRRLRALLRSAGVRSAGDLEIVERAFVHESHAAERDVPSNERMEFLGDSVLGAITAGWLFDRFPEESEGRLTVRKAAIVNDAQLARSARRLGFAQLVQLGAGMRNAGGADNTSILADAFEAFVAAVYLRYGIEKARTFVVNEHILHLDHAPGALLDSKTLLQHYAQEHLAATPTYEESNHGSPQRPEFTSTVIVNDKTLGTGTGSSKKAAQQAAARAALAVLLPADSGSTERPSQ